MLGIKSPRTPISGEVADELRDTVCRVASGRLSDSERASVQRSQKLLSGNKVIWIDL